MQIFNTKQSHLEILALPSWELLEFYSQKIFFRIYLLFGALLLNLASEGDPACNVYKSYPFLEIFHGNLKMYTFTHYSECLM